MRQRLEEQQQQQLARIAAPSRSAKNAGEGPAPGTGPAALSPNLVHPSPAVAEPPSSEPDCRASLGWRPRAFPSFRKKKAARLMLLEIAYFWVILFLFFFVCEEFKRSCVKLSSNLDFFQKNI